MIWSWDLIFFSSVKNYKTKRGKMAQLKKAFQLSPKNKKLMYVLKRNVSTYNSFSVENFKKQHMDLFEKYSTLNTRTTWSSEIKDLQS